MKPTETTMSTDSTSNGKIVSDQNIPIEELLGSVTTYNNVEGSEAKSQQLRTSARVFKKMKLDSAPVTPIVPEKKELAKEKEELKMEVKKPLRPLWLTEDKNLFFEALNEYGKDFEAIHSYISNKLKKKGLPDSVIKTKDQIRHFYYRTWHKILKHLKLPEDMKKIAQELYGLINYGEFRKKIGSVSEKACMKLNELVYRGTVAIRVKGKTIRVKTPMCRALRKLNQLDERHDELKLPTRVTVDLKPKDMNTWMKVQELSQNPRVKAVLPLQKRLSSLLTYMSHRWKSPSAIAYEKNLAAANNITSDCVPDKKITEQCLTIIDPPLRFSPPSDVLIEIPSINLSEYLTSHSICLNTYGARNRINIPYEQLWVLKGGTRRAGLKRPRQESTSEKMPSNKQANNTTDNNENCSSDPELPTSVGEVIDEAVNTLLALQNKGLIDYKEEVVTDGQEIKMEICDDVIDKKQQNISKIRNGWTLADCGTLSVGELYLMYGLDSKLSLEYSWDVPNDIKTETESCKETTEVDSKTECDIKSFSDDLATTLDKLLSVAKLHYRKTMVRCPCGHVCGEAPKVNNTVRNKSVAKNSKNNPDVQERLSVVENKEAANSAMRRPSVPIYIQPNIRHFSPTSLFKRPDSPSVVSSLKAQIDTIQRLTPRYCNRRGRRPRSKQMVVERKLPLLPNKVESGHQIVQMNIISQDDLNPRTILPKVLQVSDEEKSYAGSSNQSIDITDNATTPSRIGSPTNISNLLNLSINTESHSDINLNEASENKDDNNLPSFVGLLSEGIPNSTPPVSPSRILKENENQWLNSEVADFSLSSFLGHLESPMKSSQSTPSTAGEDSRLSQDVDAHFQSLLTETSVDYMAKFADLAAQVAENKK